MNKITIWKDPETGYLNLNTELEVTLHSFPIPDTVLKAGDEVVLYSDELEGRIQKWWITTTPPYEPEKHLVFSPFLKRLRFAWLVLWSPLKVLDELWRKA